MAELRASKNGSRRAQRRSAEEWQSELATIDQAHIQNEVARDAFLALAHTALFAASIAFIGNLGSDQGVQCRAVLVLGWAASVVGLLALTVSFHAARSHMNRRRQQIYDNEVDAPKTADLLNNLALWSFPVALVSTFAFATINILP